MKNNKTKRKDVNPIVESIPIYGTLVIVFCMVLITLSEPLMGWVWVLCACAIIIAYLRLKSGLPSVKNITLNLLAIFCMCLLIYLSNTFGLIATMINLLVVAACLKLINLSSQSDYHLVLIILFFLIACGFLYNQNVYIVAYYFACLVILFVTAFLLNRGNLDIQRSVQQSIKMIIQSFPIMLLLFIVTPRLPPFWHAPTDINTQTGLSEQITPGDIANLAQSDELVFRAEFANGKIPPVQERYWRSIVLDYFDGKTWRLNKAQYNYQQILLESEANLRNESSINYQYLIIAQPNNTPWLYSLDIPAVNYSIGNISPKVNRQYQLFQTNPQNKPTFYMLNSYTQAPRASYDVQQDYERYLQVPKTGNTRTVEWVQNNIDESMTFNEIVGTIQSYFLTQPFTYTLKPPLMQQSPVDEFLFDNQRGFCSHYASAMTYMLRLANIPARMVAGYQGGQVQGNNVMSVYQYDAHAWLEAYEPQNGWVAFDPTALVAPNRTLLGLMSALDESESSILIEQSADIWDLPVFNKLNEYLAILDHNWHQLVLNFDQRTQIDLIKKLFGELSYQTLFTFLILSIIVIVIFLTVLFLPYRKWFRKDKEPTVSAVLNFLDKQGLKRNKNESLKNFIKRIDNQLSPQFFEYLKSFSDLYYRTNYQCSSNDAEKLKLQKELIRYKGLILNHSVKEIKQAGRIEGNTQ